MADDTSGMRFIRAGDGRDRIDGKAGRDWIKGEGGSDWIKGLDGDDRLEGNLDNDLLVGGNGDDLLIGGGGDDSLADDDSPFDEELVDGDDQLLGGVGNDHLSGSIGRNLLDGGPGDDVLVVGEDDRVDAGPGDDLVKVDPLFQAGRSEITFGAGSDRLEAVFGTGVEYVEGQVPAAWQGFGTHVIRDFTRGEDRMVSVELVDAQLYDRPLGFGELDTSGDGRIDGADAEVTVTAEGLSIDYAAMAERVHGVAVDGPASLRLGGVTFLDQSDFLPQPTDGDDVITGSTGADRIDGGGGNDVLDGGRGDDTLSGGVGDDRIQGGAGDDLITGGAGDDFLEGGIGLDEIRGEEGNDVLQGVGRLVGGNGDDVIRARAGQSRVEAGAGDDRIEFAADAGVTSRVDIELGAGRDRLLVIARAYYTDPERWENWSEPSSSPPPPENWHAVGSLVVHDFARGEDTLSGITDGYGRTISFAELDRNGDGRIDAADPGVELDDGALLIDLASVARDRFGLTEVLGPSTLRLVGISALDVGDFADHPSAGANELAGSSGNDLIRGLDGDDQITGGRGDDRLFGDAGDDLLHGEDGADTLDGGTGNDTLQGDAGADRLLGGAGDDVLVVEGSDVLHGGAGDDVARIRSIRGAQDVTITLGAGTDTFELWGESGNGDDLTFPGFGSLVVRDFTHGEDLFGRISLANHVPLGLAELDNNGDGVIDGRDRGVVLQDDGLLIDIAALARFHHADQFDPLGPSTLLLEGIRELTVDDFMRRPTEGADEIVATTAADTLRLGGGDDVVRGVEGNDVLMGEAGDDRLFGEAGNDVLAGGAGDDLLSGGSGANRLMGGDGSDFLEGSGQPGASGDFMAGGAGNDRIQGSRGNDVIQGGDGDDALAGRRGSNQVWGGAGDDLIEIGMDDRIHAGIGDDVVQVASRRDYEHFRRSDITLGSGQDRFEMTGEADSRYGRGFHTLLDFRSGEDLLGELGFGAGRTIGFTELDGNGDGVVDRRDQGVGYSQGGLLIDLRQVAEQAHGPFTMGGPSALRLVGVDALRPDDFVPG